MNPNTNKPWNSGEDYWWENPDSTFWGLRDPNKSHHRVLFKEEGPSGILVCWVNTYWETSVGEYCSKKRVVTRHYARKIWDSLVHHGHVRDDSVPPRMVEPSQDPGFKQVEGVWESLPLQAQNKIKRSKSKRSKFDPMETIKETEKWTS